MSASTVSKRWAFPLLWALLAGLVGAAILHAFIILAAPYFASRDIWNSVVREDELDRFIPLSAGERNQDPFFPSVLCRFDLSEGPVRISAEGDVPFWSASIFDRRTTNVYSLSDRSTVRGRLNLLIADAVQTLELRQMDPELLDNSLLVQVDIDEGFIVLRAFQANGSWTEIIRSFLDSAVCESAPLG